MIALFFCMYFSCGVLICYFCMFLISPIHLPDSNSSFRYMQKLSRLYNSWNSARYLVHLIISVHHLFVYIFGILLSHLSLIDISLLNPGMLYFLLIKYLSLYNSYTSGLYLIYISNISILSYHKINIYIIL